jgi:riboflavin synthase
MNISNFDPEAVKKLYDEALQRSGKYTGPKVTIGSIIREAQQNGYIPTDKLFSVPAVASNTNVTRTGLTLTAPLFEPNGMPARTFVGPSVGGAKLFPLNALSLVVALGGIGKTSIMMAISAHIAAGKSWGFDSLTSRKVVMLFVEEDQTEINRKFSAVVAAWTETERQKAIENLRLVSLLSIDPRLTRVAGRDIIPTELVSDIINAVNAFGAELVVCDHLQGFAGGDLNLSDTATALTREANRIVAETKSAVVFTAHTNKSQINADVVDAGFTTGSLAFENAARQVTGLIRLPETDAKKLGVEATLAEYMLMQMPKNSYGKANQKAYARKEYVPDYHTVVVKPFLQTASVRLFATQEERVRSTIIDYMKPRSYTTKKILDDVSGEDGPLKASRPTARRILQQMIDDGAIVSKPLIKELAAKHGISHQTKYILELAD